MSPPTRLALPALLFVACGQQPTTPAPEPGPGRRAGLLEPVPSDISDEGGGADVASVPKTTFAGPEPSGSDAPQDPGRSAPPALSDAGAPALVGAGIRPRPPVWRRHVALVDKAPAAPCPAASDPGWTAERLFRRGAVATMLGDKAVLPKPLERFCLYTWAGKTAPLAPPAFAPADKVVRVDPDREVVVPQVTSLGGDPADQAALAPPADKLVRVDPDREVVVPQVAHLGGDPAVRAALADAFLRAVGAQPAGVAGPPVHGGVEGPARVAVVDTLGFAEAGLDYTAAAARQRHGIAMAEFVHALRCPDREAGCRDQLFHAQAFPYGPASPLPLASGGPLGSLASLAHALGEAVVRWQTSDMRTSPLVLNLSLGWDPRYGDPLTPVGQEATHTDLLVTPSAAVAATVQAVHAAMVYGTCLEALPIAAAGNNAGAACEQTGLMAPASWERYPAPDRARCESLFGTLPAWRAGDPAVAVTRRALVYGAGGVDATTTPIPIARVNGTPPRVLPAFQAVVGDGARQTDVLTGTSISAASLSALAAQVWSHHRVLGPHEVVALLDASGVATGLSVDIGVKARAKRIGAHDAFAHLCTIRYRGAACPNPYLPPTSPAPAQSAATISAPVSLPRRLTCTSETVQCGATPVTRTRCDDPSATSTPVVPASEPWVRPQPDLPLCTRCPVRGGKLTLALHPDHTGGAVTLSDPVLEFRRSDGSYFGARLVQVTVGSEPVEVDLARYTVDLGAGPVTLADALAREGIRGGTLGFAYTDAAGATSWLVSAVAVED
ncbi:hypothetical protein OV079_19795 [Nannocystis pusilla]|uniref:Peptidase S8/S53 domain-containing protein n=1 Tax=Nannocystis pusilla TaxID=889268 RepID=A0A9X3IYM9_9BACT|nr:hypothetical protein [Nannocystis pusilla]MCY1007754.1 hypothetical protein [Nannocystis pusilla]